MDIKTKLNLGDIVYFLSTIKKEDKCPRCDGEGGKKVDGYFYDCQECEGSGTPDYHWLYPFIHPFPVKVVGIRACHNYTTSFIEYRVEATIKNPWNIHPAIKDTSDFTGVINDGTTTTIAGEENLFVTLEEAQAEYEIRLKKVEKEQKLLFKNFIK